MSVESEFAFVASVSSLEESHGEGSDRYVVASLGRKLGLTRIGVNHETIFPGGRSSMPHAHSSDEEFVFVLEGSPTLWCDGDVRALRPGDAVAFPAGTGIAHTFINDSDAPVKLLIVGECLPDDRVVYPLDRRDHPRPWTDAPKRSLGPHTGEPRRRSS